MTRATEDSFDREWRDSVPVKEILAIQRGFEQD